MIYYRISKFTANSSCTFYVLDPGKIAIPCNRIPGGRGGGSRPDSGEVRHWRRGLGWGKGRGARCLSIGGLGASGGGRTGLTGVEGWRWRNCATVVALRGEQVGMDEAESFTGIRES
jgi:hypothetical protein